MRFAQIGEATLHVEVKLFADRPTLVFVNSLGSDLRIWDGVVDALAAARIGVVRYDLRGHGLSDLGTPPRRMEAHIDDLAGLMDKLGIARATICGISVGGMIALGLSHRHPDKVGGLILCCTGHLIGTAESWNARIAAVEQGGVASITETVLQRWFSPAAYSEGGGGLAIMRNMLARTPTAGYAATCAALRDADLTEAARTVHVPALCVAGEFDGGDRGGSKPAMTRPTTGWSRCSPAARDGITITTRIQFRRATVWPGTNWISITWGFSFFSWSAWQEVFMLWTRRRRWLSRRPGKGGSHGTALRSAENKVQAAAHCADSLVCLQAATIFGRVPCRWPSV